MSNVTPIKIDILDGRLPIKGKGLEMTEFANVAEPVSYTHLTLPTILRV